MEQRQVMENGLEFRMARDSAWHVADTLKCLDCLVSLLLVSMVGLGVWEFPQSLCNTLHVCLLLRIFPGEGFLILPDSVKVSCVKSTTHTYSPLEMGDRGSEHRNGRRVY